MCASRLPAEARLHDLRVVGPEARGTHAGAGDLAGRVPEVRWGQQSRPRSSPKRVGIPIPFSGSEEPTSLRPTSSLARRALELRTFAKFFNQPDDTSRIRGHESGQLDQC